MKQYLDLVAHVIKNGTKQANRTGVNTISFPGAMLRYDLQDGFPAITTRKLATEAAVQSGDTIMLAGLTTDSGTDSSSGIPGLSRIPVLGALFGSKGRNSGRSEVIVLLTPTIVRNGQESRDLTDEYSRRFRAMEPINTPRGK